MCNKYLSSDFIDLAAPFPKLDAEIGTRILNQKAPLFGSPFGGCVGSLVLPNLDGVWSESISIFRGGQKSEGWGQAQPFGGHRTINGNVRGLYPAAY